MKVIIGLAVMFFLMAQSQVNASTMMFIPVLCIMDETSLVSEVNKLEKKWVKAKRTKAKHSRYRRHIGKHVKQVISAFRAAEEMPSCSDERKETFRQLRVKLQAVL